MENALREVREKHPEIIKTVRKYEFLGFKRSRSKSELKIEEKNKNVEKIEDRAEESDVEMKEESLREKGRSHYEHHEYKEKKEKHHHKKEKKLKKYYCHLEKGIDRGTLKREVKERKIAKQHLKMTFTEERTNN